MGKIRNNIEILAHNEVRKLTTACPGKISIPKIKSLFLLQNMTDVTEKYLNVLKEEESKGYERVFSDNQDNKVLHEIGLARIEKRINKKTDQRIEEVRKELKGHIDLIATKVL